MEYKTTTFYKYIDLKDPEETKGHVKGLCQGLNLLGRVLIGKEGINAGVSGRVQDIERFKEILEKNKEFTDLTYREQASDKNTYHKLIVKTRKEIVVLNKEVDLAKKGEHINPERLKKWMERGEKMTILDARNDYEAELGKFKDAIVLPIKNFRDFPEEAEKALKGKEDEKIVMYCTSGIRCEKSSAYLREKGFKKVFQLQGGIVNYTTQFKDDNFEGSCFVFDDRLSDGIGEEDPLTNCKICSEPSDKYLDCHNMDCDKLFICCERCQKEMNNTCSLTCKDSSRHRDMKLELKQV